VVRLCVVLPSEEQRHRVHRGSHRLKSVALHRVGLLCVGHGHGIHLRVVRLRVGLLCVGHGHGIHLRVVRLRAVHGHGIHLHEVPMNALKCEVRGRGIHLREERLHVGQNYEE
jgi:hypothetical protein